MEEKFLFGRDISMDKNIAQKFTANMFDNIKMIFDVNYLPLIISSSIKLSIFNIGPTDVSLIFFRS